MTEMDGEPTWESAVERFVADYDSLYGQVRTEVVHAHLRAHLPEPPATLVDVGGGAGHQAIPLAREGYEVTAVDPSEAMLAEAARAREAESPEVARRLHLVRAEGHTAPALLGERRYDGVLCHGVLLYLDDPEPMVAALCALVRPGGVVSIVTKNARTLAMRPGRRGDWKRAMEAFDSAREVNVLGIETRADTVDGISRLLLRHGVDPVAWYGVRLFTEEWGRDQPRTDSGDAVFAAELEASRRDPYRQLSRLFHLVGVRRGA